MFGRKQKTIAKAKAGSRAPATRRPSTPTPTPAVPAAKKNASTRGLPRVAQIFSSPPAHHVIKHRRANLRVDSDDERETQLPTITTTTAPLPAPPTVAEPPATPAPAEATVPTTKPWSKPWPKGYKISKNKPAAADLEEGEIPATIPKAEDPQPADPTTRPPPPRVSSTHPRTVPPPTTATQQRPTIPLPPRPAAAPAPRRRARTELTMLGVPMRAPAPAHPLPARPPPLGASGVRNAGAPKAPKRLDDERPKVADAPSGMRSQKRKTVSKEDDMPVQETRRARH